MSQDFLEQKTSRSALQILGKKYLTKECIERALVLSGFLPDKKAWHKFLDTFFMLLGITLLLTGISFFFAYNWASLSKFAKLGMIQAGILISILFVFYKGLDNLAGKSLLFFAAVLVGTFLAVFGQIYQTGADAYELFVGWFFFIIGWTLVSNNTGLWFFSILILDIAIVLGMAQTARMNTGEEWGVVCEILCAVHFLPLVIWDFFSFRWEWMNKRWFSRILVLAVLYFSIVPVLILIFDRKEATHYIALQISPIIYGIIMVFLFLYYQYKKQDLAILTMNCIGLIVVISCLFGESMIKKADDVIALSLLVIVQASIASFWLRKVWKKWTA